MSVQWNYVLKISKFTIISQFIYFIFLERPRSPWEVHAEPLGLRGAQVGNLWTRPLCSTAARFNKLRVFCASPSSMRNYCAVRRDHTGKANKYLSCRCWLVFYRPVRVYLWGRRVLLCGRTALLNFHICTVHLAIIRVFFFITNWCTRDLL